MRILTKHTELNTIKIWDNVKAFNSFRTSLELNRGLEGKLSYYLVIGKEEIQVLPDFSIYNGYLKTYNKVISTYDSVKSVMKNWMELPEERIPVCYSESDQQKIALAKTFQDHDKIEAGSIEAPVGYPLIPMVSCTDKYNQETVELVLHQVIQIKEIV